jgi:hypothetical protein
MHDTIINYLSHLYSLMDYPLLTPFWIQSQLCISLKVLQGEAVCVSCVGM